MSISRLGVVLPPTGAWKAQAAEYRWAEDVGYDVAYTYDHLTHFTVPGEFLAEGFASLAAAAAVTERIRFAPSVLISPYRHPLSDARQLATADVLSNGRMIAGVGAGWMKEEFDALGLPYEGRGRMLEECVEIYRRSWTEEWVNFDGEFYRFDDVSMDPKPVQAQVPLVFGAASKAGVAEEAGFAYKDLAAVVDTLHRLDLSRHVVSLTPIGNIKG